MLIVIQVVAVVILIVVVGGLLCHDDRKCGLSERPDKRAVIFKERMKRGAVCPRCRHPDYTMYPPVEGETIKPEFRCKACGYSWAYGYDGGRYAELVTPNKEVTGGDSRPVN